MCLIKGASVGEKNSDVIKMHGTTIKIKNYLLTYSNEKSPSWEANRFSASQEIPRILLNPKVH
jgi:hypothetical protein